jgi:hypothetical protein
VNLSRETFHTRISGSPRWIRTLVNVSKKQPGPHLIGRLPEGGCSDGGGDRSGTMIPRSPDLDRGTSPRRIAEATRE